MRHPPRQLSFLTAAALLGVACGAAGERGPQEHTVGGVMSGLAPGNAVVLQNNLGDNLIVGDDGPFRFATPLPAGDSYAVTILLQPTRPTQACVVGAGLGVLGDGNVNDVLVSCTTATHTIGGTASGLAAGNSVMLRLTAPTGQGGSTVSDLEVTADGLFEFPPLAEGTAYDVTILTHPSSPNQTCSIAGGSGVVEETDRRDIVVDCTTLSYFVRGTVVGLDPGETVVLRKGTEYLTIDENGLFWFSTRVVDGTGYNVVISSQPTGDDCWIAGGSGTMAGRDVWSVAVTCQLYRDISMGAYTTVCALIADGSLWCDGGGAASYPPAGDDFFGVAVGDRHGCSVRHTGELVCWGTNNYGQTDAPAGADFVSVEAGTFYNCAVKVDGTVACWGRDDYGESTPPADSGIAAVSAGDAHTCALRTNGSLICWGRNYEGQCNAPPGFNYAAVTAGRDFSCALRTDQSIVCWGDDGYNQASPPAGQFTAISAGLDHTCALRASDGGATCWGRNNHLQTDEPSMVNFEVLSAGGYRSCASWTDGVIYIWGYP